MCNDVKRKYRGVFNRRYYAPLCSRRADKIPLCGEAWTKPPNEYIMIGLGESLATVGRPWDAVPVTGTVATVLVICDEVVTSGGI